MAAAIRVIGIDPGLVKTGYGIVEFIGQSFSVIADGVIRVETKLQLADRLFCIYNDVNDIIKKYAPECGAIEETYVNSGAISSLKLAQARASAILAAKQNGLDITAYQAKTIKKTICGNGNADKVQVAAMLSYLMPSNNIQSKGYDNTDAIAIAICHILHVRK